MSTLFDTHFSNRFVLTLKENTNRRRNFELSSKKAGISNIKAIFSKKYLFSGNFKNTASRSITSTHIKIHNLGLEDPYSHLVIFEDDVEFDPEFKLKLEPILNDLMNRDWDIFYFFKPYKGIHHDFNGDRGEILETHDSGLLKITGTLNSHAYAINRKFLPDFVKIYNIDYIKTLDPRVRLIDKSLFSLRLNVYSANEDLAYQNPNFESSTKNAKPYASFFENVKLYFRPKGNNLTDKK